MTEEKDRKKILVAASRAGNFLEAVYKSYLADGGDREDLAIDVAALHSEGLVDVVAEFEKLDNDQSGHDFFMTRHVLEKALPRIDAPVSAVMRCALQLMRRAGRDMAAGTILDGYIGFCAAAPSRALEAMTLIEAMPGELADMLPATIAAGSRIDNPRYVAEVIRLSAHPEKILRQRAVFAMSRIHWPKGASVPDSILSALEESAASSADDEILASVIKSSFAHYRQDSTTESRVTAIIGEALPKGDEYTLHAAADLLGFHTKDLPPPLLDLLLGHLKRVKPTNRGTLDGIDYGIAHLLKGNDAEKEKGLQFLEEFLPMQSGVLTIKVFDSAAGEIRRDNALLSKVTTRWLLKDTRALWESVWEIGGTHYGEDLVIDLDSAELEPKDLVHMEFLARKAIGYFFMKPVTAASILVSLMRLAPDDRVIDRMGRLLFDPLLLNYPGSAYEYVQAQAGQETGKVKETLDEAMASIDGYLKTLRAVPVLPALHPGQAHREAYRRHISESTGRSFKEAEKKSVFLNLVTRSTLLYGRKSINYIYPGAGAPQRMEMPLKSHSVEMEIPRMESLDDHGLNYMLRVFRLERLRT